MSARVSAMQYPARESSRPPCWYQRHLQLRRIVSRLPTINLGGMFIRLPLLHASDPRAPGGPPRTGYVAIRPLSSDDKLD